MLKKVLITGVTGQDGSHMVDYLLKNSDFQIFGSVRRISVANYANIKHNLSNKRFSLVNLDLSDPHSIRKAIEEVRPDYFINFAAQSFVTDSWDFPIQTWDCDSTAIIHILESIRLIAPYCRFYNAGSSEEFGDIVYSPQNESHPLNPQSPYGAAKAGARQIVRVYRESFNLFAIQGWLFNHEGTRRGEQFVTRKISSTIAKIKISIENKKLFQPLLLGNLNAERDWTDAEDFMEGVWLMLNQSKPKNYVLSSGKTYSIRFFLEECLKVAGIQYTCRGKGLSEAYYDNEGNILVAISPDFFRPAEVNHLLGDPQKAEKELGWTRKCDIYGLISKMYHNDYKLESEKKD
jgi:GDPmannose 4,6-dehydratase